MVGKIWSLMFAFVVLVSISATAFAATCGDGKCEAEESCSTCPDDCGSCNGVACVSDDTCASNICCKGVCRDSCIVYSATREEDVTGLFLSSPINSVIFATALIIAVIAVILIFWRKRKSA